LPAASKSSKLTSLPDPALKSAALARASIAGISANDLPGVDLSSVGVETSMADGRDIPNDRQNVGGKLRGLRLAAHAHALDDTGGVAGVPSRLPGALAAVRAALVRSEMASRSSSATAAGGLFLSQSAIRKDSARGHCAVGWWVRP
jgi:hypothetical protein